MLASKSKTNKLCVIILVFFICTSFFFSPLKTFASDVVVKSIISPTNGTETITTMSHPGSEYKFKFTFDVPVINPIPAAPKDVDAIVFEGKSDIGKKGYQYIWNQRRKDWEGKTVTAKWNIDISKITIPIGSKSFTWSLYDYYTKTRYVDNQTISFKDDNNYKGWYFIYKTESQTAREYIFSVSSKYATEAECNAGWTALFKDNSNVIAYTNPTCKEYNTLPPTPQNEKIILPDEQNTTKPQAGETETNYTLLEPLPDGNGGTLYNFESNPSKEPCAFAKYLNILVRLFLGICAVLAVIMMVYGGLEYIISQTPAEKGQHKNTLLNAVLGLIIALGAYLLLFTINPNLLNVCLDAELPTVEVKLKDFDVSGPLLPTETSAPVKITFKNQAYPAAKNASKATGVDQALILAVFQQETQNGRNTGKCNYLTANMGNGQLEALKQVASILKLDYTKINMSCSGGGSSHGGAIGYTQFLPGTWLMYNKQAASFLGHEPNPWNTDDSLMMTALKLKSDGGISNPKGAVCKYFGSCRVVISCGDGTKGTYGDCIMAKVKKIQQGIDAGIKAGIIDP